MAQMAPKKGIAQQLAAAAVGKAPAKRALEQAEAVAASEQMAPKLDGAAGAPEPKAPLLDGAAGAPEPKASKRVVSTETHNRGFLMTYIGFHLSDKCKNEESKKRAMEMKAEYLSLDAEMAGAFAAKFMATKKDKEFSWVRNFKECFTATKTEDTKVKQNYLTRL